MNYLLAGEETYLRNQKLQAIIQDLQCSDMNVVFYDATKHDAQSVISDCNTMPFFSDNKVVVLESCKFLTSAGLAYDEDAILAYLKQPLESTTFVLVCDSKIDARKKIGKEITKCVQLLKYNTLDQYERDKYIQMQVSKLQLKFEPQALGLFKERVGFDVANIVSELNKLTNVGGVLSVEIVSQLVVRPIDDDVFILSNAISNHDLKTSFKALADFKKINVEVIALIALLASHFRFLSQVKSLSMMGMNKQAITSELNAHPFRVEKTLQTTHNRDLDEIKRILNELGNLDQQIKKGLIDRNLGFELFILKFCS